MTETKFTPGPWHTRLGMRTIQVTAGEYVWPIGYKEDAVANADLIAAAPDMYAALETAYAALVAARHELEELALEFSGEDYNSPRLNAAIEDTRAAMDKARESY